MSPPSPPTPRVLIVAEHASAAFGGEAILPLHYFSYLRKRGVETWMIVHDRTRDELLARFPEDRERLLFVADTEAHRLLCRGASALPSRLGEPTLGLAVRMLTQRTALRMARQVVRQQGIDVVHQPIPVSPKEPSSISDVGAPVVIGPMNGGMTFPRAFRRLNGPVTRLVVPAARMAAALVNQAIPGKLRAETLVVANKRTGQALPAGARGRVVELPENGVDLPLWSQTAAAPVLDQPPRFVFLGRLVDWKAVDVLLEAFARARQQTEVQLEIAGDGPERPRLEQLAATLGVAGSVQWSGWLPQHQIAPRLRSAAALVLPSVYECGGAVVLEAMASGLPVIATAWGGPIDYLDDRCGILVPPDDRESLVQGFTEAMVRLARSPELRQRLGEHGRQRVQKHYDWERKIDRMLEIYQDAISRHRARARA